MQPHGVGPARRRAGRTLAGPHLHLRPHVPCRKLEHPAPCVGVLDDRAGSGLLRTGGQHGTGRGFPQIPHPVCAGQLHGRPRIYEQDVGQGAAGASALCAGARFQASRLHRRHRDSEGFGPQVRIPLRLGLRPAIRARALPRGGALQASGHPDQLPQGHQGLLHEAERRRQDGARHGRIVPGNRRNHRRFGARGRLWQTSCKSRRIGHEREGTLVVSRYPPLGFGAALGLRPGLRPPAAFRDGHDQHP